MKRDLFVSSLLVIFTFSSLSVVAAGLSIGEPIDSPSSLMAEQDVDLGDLGQDLIPGEYWTATVDFSGGAKYYFDPNAPEGGDGSREDPFMALADEIVADNHIERRAIDGDPTVTNSANNPVVGPGDVCVLMGGNHGNIEFYKYYFPDYIGIVSMPGQRVLFNSIWMRASSYFYFEGLEANPENTRNGGGWDEEFEHTLGEYDDYDDAPFFVRTTRDENGLGNPNHIVFNHLRVGISSGDLPASWGHEDWNSNVVGGFDIIRTHQVQVQNCYGNGMSHAFNVFNYNLATPQQVQILNNNFRYLNGDGVYSARTQGNQIAGNRFSDFYISNDDHVGGIEIYYKVADHLVEGNYIVATSVLGRNPVMAGYTADGGTEGVGITGIMMIGGNTNSVIRNNIIHDNAYGALAFRTTYGSSYNVLVANNTVVCDILYPFNTGGDTGLLRTEIVNVGSDTLGVTFVNNICSEVRIGHNDSWSTETNNSEYALDFSGAGFTNYTQGANPLNQSFRLVANSENVDAGANLVENQEDSKGLCRPKGGWWDIGADEFDDGNGCNPLMAPVALVATAGDGVVLLDWADNTEINLASYTVYRDTISGGLSSLQINIQNSDFSDNTVENGIEYFYTVTAVSTMGGESHQSSEVSATPIGDIPWLGHTIVSNQTMAPAALAQSPDRRVTDGCYNTIVDLDNWTNQRTLLNYYNGVHFDGSDINFTNPGEVEWFVLMSYGLSDSLASAHIDSAKLWIRSGNSIPTSIAQAEGWAISVETPFLNEWLDCPAGVDPNFNTTAYLSDVDSVTSWSQSLTTLSGSADVGTKAITPPAAFVKNDWPTMAFDVTAGVQNMVSEGLPLSFLLSGRGNGNYDWNLRGHGDVTQDRRPYLEIWASAPGAAISPPVPSTNSQTKEQVVVPKISLACYPNPFNPSTQIRFSTTEHQQLRLSIYGVDGRLVATLVNEMIPAGIHEVTWSGNNDSGQVQASGVYLCRIEAGANSQVQKLTLMK